MIWLLVGYMWLYIHRPFEVWTILATLRIERVYMICTLIIWLTSTEKKFTSNLFNVAALLFIIALTLATLLSSYTNVIDNVAYQDFLKVAVFYLLVMTVVKTEKDLKIIVSAAVVCFFLYLAHSYREYLNGHRTYAAGAERMIGMGSSFSEFNDFGTWIVCMMPLTLPLVTLCKRMWHYLFIAGYILLSLRCVQLTGSRGAFIMVVALGVLPVIFSKYRMRLIPVILVLGPAGWFSMPESMQNRYRTIWDSSISEQANANARGRTKGFYDGMKNWANSPLYGVGVGMHGPALGQRFQAHNLEGQIAGETGTLGILAFLSILACFGINHWNVLQNYKRLQEWGRGKEGLYCYRVSTGVVWAVVMSLVQGLSLHNGYRFYWLWFGAFQSVAAMLIQEKVNAARHLKAPPPAGSVAADNAAPLPKLWTG
ncbi:MAG: O-antigen ligase family protein [Planctomycetaceae bacterium]|jgi:O-antigen ligase|nr:O-antigen ligase family protein [Planctomycetaceae bacterium]